MAGHCLFKENIMATIVIKDLSDNLDLDRKAMQAVMGGSRLRSRGRTAGAAPSSTPGIVDFKTRAVPRSAPAKKNK
jgi:hypothetical protein